MRCWIGISAFLGALWLAAPAGAQSVDCQDVGGFCTKLVSPACMARLGAGAAPIEDAGCAAELRAYRDCVAFVSESCAGAAAAPADPVRPTPSGASTYEPNVNRLGGDFAMIDLDSEDPAVCQRRCLDDARCKAWSFVAAGLQGPAPKCWLKSSVPAATPWPGVTSGEIAGR